MEERAAANIFREFQVETSAEKRSTPETHITLAGNFDEDQNKKRSSPKTDLIFPKISGVTLMLKRQKNKLKGLHRWFVFLQNNLYPRDHSRAAQNRYAGHMLGYT